MIPARASLAAVALCVSCATVPPAPAEGPPASPVAAQANPFAGARMYSTPDYAEAVASVPPPPDYAAAFRAAATQPVGLWLDSIARVGTVRRHLTAALAEQSARHEPVVVTFVLYDLPNRDCAAKSSAGELAVEADGERRYRAEYIAPIATAFRAFPQLRIVVIVEPDSLANLATNLAVPKCAASDEVYRRSIAFALSELAMPHVHAYLDAAHAGWLGWEGNRAKIARIYKDVLAAAGGTDRIRGFATNVSNYNVLEGDDGKRLEPSDPCPDELTYIRKLTASLAAVGIEEKGFIVDTSRNGRPGIRSRWGNWCNVRGAGLGPRPRAAPAPLVDAFFWVKPPGESDGTSDVGAARFDPTCASADSAKGAPEAGRWFPQYFTELVRNANPPL
jgi:cellulose 1,4-beta-cellobiosidase